MLTSKDLGEYYRVSPDKRDLNYAKYFDTEIKISIILMNTAPIIPHG